MDYLAANWAHLNERLPEVLPGVRLHSRRPPSSRLDLSGVDRLQDDNGKVTAPAARLRTFAKVALNEGTDFGPVGAGHARLNFGTSREILDEALDRIAAAESHASEPCRRPQRTV